MEIDILRQFPAAVRELREVTREPENIRRDHRTTFFARQIQPMHEAMEQIHDDYMAAFRELARLLDDRQGLDRAVRLMRERQVATSRLRLDVEVGPAGVALST